ncbi:MAG: alpha-L-arabinofuranosidase C-terminal domain-containing protein [Puniceicoccaceae bacterium]
MKSRIRFSFFLNLLVAGMVSSGVCASQPPVRIEIDATAPTRAISSDLVGAFFEDLNYAADGGLYAELIQNRSFEYSATERTEWGPLSFWELVKSGGGEGHLRVGEVRPLHVNNPHYAIMVVTDPGEQGVGLANSGFGGVAVQAGKAYRASFWSYQLFQNRQWGPDSDPGDQATLVSLELRSHSGEVLASQHFEVHGRKWTQYSTELIPSASDEQAQLVLSVHAAGGLAVDMVSLFPRDTFRGHENGLRRDLAEHLAAMQPRFVRFPGGCLVHGQSIHTFYDWKKTVGPIEQRQSQRNLWGYHQTNGLGYHEYFQFCEDLDAIPLPVVAAGVCCQHGGDSPHRGQEGLPMEAMPAYIQDILDLIEWANGPADSEWGAVRAAAGRTEPWGLKYLGVGNEDAITPAFEERFRMIHEVLKERHPEIVVVGTVGPFASGEDYDNGWRFANELDLAMVDEHYYVPPQWFWDNLHRYDAYDRSKAKVYVGEYAAHEPDRRNTLRSALAEAAGLIGFERNGDVVKFASYAPLLARRGHTQWTPDLVYFTQTDIVSTPNYFVQKLFGNHAGDQLLACNLHHEKVDGRLAVSAVQDSRSGDWILKIVNGDDQPRALSISLSGLEMRVPVTGHCVVLTGPSLDAVNDDAEVPVVFPRESPIAISQNFAYEAPAHALSVIRWNARSN